MEKLGINLGNHLENTALIVVDFENSVKSLHKISYNELQEQVLKLSLFIEEEGIPNKSTIGIYGKKSYGLIALSLAVLEQSCAFSYLAKDDIQNGALDDFDVKHFFSESQLIDNGSIKLTKKLTVCDQVYYFYKTSSTKEPRVYNDAGDERNQICYTITTSGTTGRRKIVRVTYNSIAPNMASLQKVFQLDSSDIILSSAPVTFDVFIMDLFLALYSGAALKIIPNELRFDPAEATSVSFIQITPTIFIQYGLENIQKKIMHAHSRLK
jgi:non-ribosomal peptide synthetase component F